MVVESESEKVIRSLYQITNDYQKGFDIQISQLLMMGLERFDLDIGILSHIDGNKYTVLHCVTPEGVELNDGDTFEFDKTYCEITCHSIGPVMIENMGEHDQYAIHPAYQAFGLESYIGVPIFIDDEIFGTLNFSSAIPYPRKFKDIDVDALKLMASWIEVELIRRKQEDRLQQLNARLEYQAYHDALTGVANRRSMFKTVHLDIERMKRAGGKGTLAVVDIDHFKRVNDTHGHQVGDEVLKKVASAIKGQLVESDFIARFGGEEFIVWLPERDVEIRREIVEKVRSSVNSIEIDGRPMTVSVGSCEFDFANLESDQSDTATLHEIIQVADNNLYTAKDTGRNRTVCSSWCEQRNTSSEVQT
ncbi:MULTISPECIES: sensor domain-containing diguanylate cyclase [Vibrio]|uniref:diguanylate cyclase n=1 Tax=Vibrio bivalvicida TaxID=1276888 RepID=A0A177XUR9_9VIBR|nr:MULTISPECIES: diguanylate cyclase [Vibrio]KLN65784.1 diguanylate cyclase [Vibrio sp. VPAP30]OAJ92378.1 diguanylate cyclase [Vibrio bivalvicida]